MSEVFGFANGTIVINGSIQGVYKSSETLVWGKLLAIDLAKAAELWQKLPTPTQVLALYDKNLKLQSIEEPCSPEEQAKLESKWGHAGILTSNPFVLTEAQKQEVEAVFAKKAEIKEAEWAEREALEDEWYEKVKSLLVSYPCLYLNGDEFCIATVQVKPEPNGPVLMEMNLSKFIAKYYGVRL